MLLLAGAAHAGGEAALFQEIAVSARQAALGEAGIASEGLDLVPANPAAFSAASGPALNASHLALGPDTALEELLLGLPVGPGAVHLHALMLHSSDLPALDDQGVQVGLAGYRESAVGAGWSMKIRALSLGISGRQLFRTIGGGEGGGQSFSAGLQAALPKGLRAGFAWRNAGLLNPLANAADPLQASVQGGLAWRVALSKSDSLELFSQLQRQPGGELRSSVAGEFGLGQVVFVRGAWQFLGPESAQSRMSMGLGVQGRGLSMDLAWVPMGDLGQSYRLTASIYPDRWNTEQPSLAPNALRAQANEKGFLLEWRGQADRYLVYGAVEGEPEKQLTQDPIRERRLQVRARPGNTYTIRVAALDRNQRQVASSDYIEVALPKQR